MLRSYFSGWQKQHRVKEGETLTGEAEVETSSTLSSDRVLLIANGDDVKSGAQLIEGAKSDCGKVVSHGRHDKIKIIQFPSPKASMKRQRPPSQWFTEVKSRVSGLISESTRLIELIRLIKAAGIPVTVAIPSLNDLCEALPAAKAYPQAVSLFCSACKPAFTRH